MIGTILITAIISTISEIIAITFPSKVKVLASADKNLDDSILDNLGLAEKIMLYTSFAQIILIPLLISSQNNRFISYAIFNIVLMIVGKITKQDFLKSEMAILVSSSIQLFILIDVIRSCVVFVING
jgi:hypothetical protein